MLHSVLQTAPSVVLKFFNRITDVRRGINSIDSNMAAAEITDKPACCRIKRKRSSAGRTLVILGSFIRHLYRRNLLVCYFVR